MSLATVRAVAAPALTAALAVAAAGLTPAPASTAVGRGAPHRAEQGVERAASAPAPLVFGHRGASGYRPEHTLASYDLAIRLGADVIEPDLVSTKDRVLVARHENEISTTTDVAAHPEFAGRRTTKTVDGAAVTGWFTEDFTLAELRTLRAKERLPEVRQENTVYDGRYRVPTFQEVLDLAARASRQYGRRIGVAPETKHPTYFDSLGLSLEEPLVAALRRNGLNHRRSNVFVQSFEESNLRELRERFRLRLHLVQLTSPGATSRPYDHVATGDPQTYAAMTTPTGLREIATYADWLGPEKSQIFPRTGTGATRTATTLVRDAHRAGLRVVPYTYRAENRFLPVQWRSSGDLNAFGDLAGELEQAFRVGVDGVFTDQPDIAVVARQQFRGEDTAMLSRRRAG